MAAGLTGNIEVDWGRIKDSITAAAAGALAEKSPPPKKEWISEETLNMLEHRRELIEAGLTQTARELDKDIKAAAREDRVKWLEGKITDNFWDPVKMLTKPRAQKVVALTRDKGHGGVDSKPCEVYADHLEEVQWGTSETAGPGEGRKLAPQGVEIEVGGSAEKSWIKRSAAPNGENSRVRTGSKRTLGSPWIRVVRFSGRSTTNAGNRERYRMTGVTPG